MTVIRPKEGIFRVICALSIFALLSLVYLGVMIWNGMSSLRSQREEVINSESRMTDTEATIINTKMGSLTSDLRFVHDTVIMSGFTPDGFKKLETLWTAYSNRQKIYHHMRFIAPDGQEIIRINYSPSRGAYVVPLHKLQNKSEKYYFVDSIGLKDDQVYISKLDLNMENFTIEQPIKPMIRLTTPCFDKKGELRGIVCLNYLAEDLIKRIRNAASAGHGIIYLLNPNGYWLFNGENSDTEWAFMYPQRRMVSFASSFPEVWKKIKSTWQGCIVTEQGIFTYKKVLASNEGEWTIVSYIPEAGAKSEPFSWDMARVTLWIAKRNLPAILVIFALAAAMAVIISNSRNKKELMRYYSEYDAMTGMLNRRAGLERLEELCQKSARDGGRVTLCFIDINGLKDANDTHGHEAGDELIQTVIKAIRSAVRKDDFLVRLGGDEFLVVFENLAPAAVEHIWARIASAMEAENAGGKHSFEVSASHGTAMVMPGESPDEALRLADERMYAEKRKMKKERGAKNNG